jgi:hypothetical protein
VGDDLRDFVFRYAVVESTAKVTTKLLGPVGTDQGGEDDKAAVTLAQTGTLPDVAVNDVFGHLDHFGNGGTNSIACTHRWLCHELLPPLVASAKIGCQFGANRHVAVAAPAIPACMKVH